MPISKRAGKIRQLPRAGEWPRIDFPMACFHLSSRTELILDKQKPDGRRRSRLQERLDKLRSTLERQRRRNDRFRQDLDELVAIYHRRSMENDKVVFDDRRHPILMPS